MRLARLDNGEGMRKKEAEDRLQKKEERTAKDAFSNAEEEKNAAIVGERREAKARDFKLRYFDKSESTKNQKVKEKKAMRTIMENVLIALQQCD